MATTESNWFEIERRVIVFKSTTTLPDGSALGYNGNPNFVISGNTEGETLIYNCPMNTRYSEDDGSEWTKKTVPNTWVKLGSTTLIELDDTPSSYDNDKYLKSTTSGSEWATISGAGGSDVQLFSDLLDTPTTYSGAEGKYLRVTSSGIEFSEIIGGFPKYYIPFGAIIRVGEYEQYVIHERGYLEIGGSIKLDTGAEIIIL